MEDKYTVLKRYFGYGSFREGQEQVIDSLLSGRDVLGVMPTGAGKSICFQIPALLFSGITIVLSPLISLMKDQVGALGQAGIRAAYLNGSLSSAQYAKALQNARQGIYKIIYVAPERLETESFRRFAQEADISLVTVDEAHCVSQWGQDFRPSYQMVSGFVESLSRRPVVGAFTATATPEVRRDIVELLRLRNPEIVFTGFNRPNLYFEVRRMTDSKKLLELRLLLQERVGKSGIVYCSTRKAVDEVYEALLAGGFAVSKYHAGLSDAERRQNQEDFLYDRKLVMMATNAFGMGIDKSNVSFVFHFNMPKDLESYYQEAGRAGRDGEPAECILLYSKKDVRTGQFLIEQGEAREGEMIDGALRAQLLQRGMERLKQMTFYCNSADCLRDYMLQYFGEKSQGYCGNCFNCLHNFEETEITTEAQMILSCVKRTGERYGGSTIAAVLCGSQAERMRQTGLNRQTTYGLMAGVTADRVREMIRWLEMHGYLASSDDEYHVLRLGPNARRVLFEGERLSMRLLKEEDRPKRADRSSSGNFGEAPVDEALFERLRELRNRLAQEQKVPSYIVFSNAALQDMCRKRPRTQDEFLEVSGVGKHKLELYGGDFLEEITAYLEER